MKGPKEASEIVSGMHVLRKGLNKCFKRFNVQNNVKSF